MITDERITELWNLASNTATSKPDWTYSEIIFATVRAVIAEHDAELRKQEPKAVWLQMSNETGFPSRVNSEAHLCAIKHPDFAVENLYLTPKPPHDEASLKALYTAPMPTPSQQARPLDEWDEWNGNVLWWKFPIDEPPYVGTPLDTDWPKYHTHWTPLGVPDMPLPAPIPPTVPDTNLETATNRNYLESIGQLPPTEGSKP